MREIGAGFRPFQDEVVKGRSAQPERERGEDRCLPEWGLGLEETPSDGLQSYRRLRHPRLAFDKLAHGKIVYSARGSLRISENCGTAQLKRRASGAVLGEENAGWRTILRN